MSVRSVLVAACSAAFLFACSSGSGGTTAVPVPRADAGEPDESAAVPQAIVTATLRAASTGACSQAGRSFTVGGFTPPTAVANGATEPRGRVNVSCKVRYFYPGVALDAVVDVADGSVGAVTFAGEVGFAGMASRFVGPVGFHLPGFDYESYACTIDPNVATGGPGGIAVGRIWATFHCDGARAAGSYDLCQIDGEIRFENCAQH